MFKKLSKALGGAAKGPGMKYKFDLQVVSVDRLPQSVKKCRVVWARSAKVQMTPLKDVRNGTATFKHTMTQVSSIQRGKTGDFEAKEYTIKIQIPQGTGNDNLTTVAKVTLDLAQYAMDTSNTQNETLPITYKLTSSSKGYIKLVVTATPLGEMSEDAMTELSNMTGLTSEGTSNDQDLDGFDDSKKGAASPDPSKSRLQGSTRGKSPLPTTKEGSDEGDQDDREEDPADLYSKRRPAKPAAKPPPKAFDDDEDISPVGSELSEEEDARPAQKPGPAKAEAVKKPPEPKIDFSDMKAALFSKTRPNASSSSADTGSKKGSAPAPPVVPDNEDDARAALFSSTAKKPKASAGGSRAAAADEQDEESARNALFSSTKKPKDAAGKGSEGKASSKAGAAAPVEQDEDAARSALFAAPKKSTSKVSDASKGGSKGASAAAPIEEQDEDAARNALFSATKKPPKAEAGSSKAGASKSKGVAAPPPEIDEDEGRAALFSTTKKPTGGSGKLGSKAKAAASSGFDDEPAFPAAESSGKLGKAGKAGGRRASTSDSEGGDELGVKRTSANTAATSRKAPVGSAAGTSNPQLSKVLAENRSLQEELEQLQQHEAKVSLQLRDAQVRIRELEDKLDEADPTDLYTQLSEMEAAHAAQLKKLTQQYEARIAELEDQLIEADSMLTAATSKSRSAAPAAVDTQALAEKDQQLAALSSELKKANKLLEDSMVAAVRAQQERKDLAAEVERLRSAPGRRAGRSDSDEEDEEAAEEREQLVQQMRAEIEELQARNKALQKASDGVQQDVERQHQEAAHAMSRAAEQVTELGLAPPDNQETGPLAGLLRTVSCLCHAHQDVSAQLETSRSSVEALTRELSDLEGMVQLLTGQSNNLEVALQEAKADKKQLSEQVTTLTQQLNSGVAAASAMGMSSPLTPRSTYDPRATGDSDAFTPGSQQQQADLSTPEAAVKRLQEEKATLERQLHDLSYQLKQIKSSAEVNQQSLQQEVLRLTSELEAAASDVLRLRVEAQQNGAGGSTRSLQLGGLGAGAAGAGQEEQLQQQVLELQREKEEWTKEKKELLVRLEEFSEAEAVIQEWADYADTLTAERDALAVARDSAMAEKEAVQASLPQLQQQCQALQQQCEAVQQQCDALQEHNQGLQQQCESLKQRESDLLHRMAILEAELQHEVAALKRHVESLPASPAQPLPGLRTAATTQTENGAAAKQPSFTSSSLSHRLSAGMAQTEAGDDDDEEEAQRVGSSRGWTQRMEALVAKNLSLQAQIKGLQAALVAARSAVASEVSPARSARATTPLLNRGMSSDCVKLPRTIPAPGGGESLLSPRQSALKSRTHAHGDSDSGRKPLLSSRHDQPSPSHDDASQGSEDHDHASSSSLSSPEASRVHSWQDDEQQDGVWRTTRNLVASRRSSSVSSEGSDTFLSFPQAVWTSKQPAPGHSKRHTTVPSRTEWLSLSQALEQLAAAQAELVELRESVSSIPLLPARDADDSADPSHALTPAQPAHEDITTDHQLLHHKVSLLTAWRAQAEVALQALQEERAVLKADRAQAQEAFQQLKLDLATREAELQQLSSQLELHSKSISIAGGTAPDTSSGTVSRSKSSRVQDRTGTALNRATREIDGGLAGSGQAEDLQSDTGALALEGQLRTAAAVVFVTRQWLASCKSIVSSQKAVPVSQDIALDVALMCMKDESQSLYQELQRQACEAPRFEAQVAMATQQVVELQAQCQELHEENLMLARMHTPPLNVAGPPGTPASEGLVGFQQASPSWSHRSLARSSHNAAASGHNTTYGDEAGLTMSAMEQQLALAESQRQDALTEAAGLERDNTKLRRTLEQLKAELASAKEAAELAQQATKAAGKSKASKLRQYAASDEEGSEADETTTTTTTTTTRRGTQDKSGPEVEQLRQRCAKLEDMCAELEASADKERQALEAQLSAAVQEAEDVRAALAAQAQRPATPQVSDDTRRLRTQVQQLEMQVSRLSRECGLLAEQVEEEKEHAAQLEAKVKKGLADMNEDEVLETVEAFEKKYNKLKDRYKRLETASASEISELNAHLTSVQRDAEEVRQQAAAAAAAAAVSRPAGRAAGQLVGVPGREADVRRETDGLLKQLLDKQLEAAEMAEQQAVLKRELYRAKEINMKLAAKMTKLEAQAYSGKTERKLFGRKKKSGGSDEEEEEE